METRHPGDGRVSRRTFLKGSAATVAGAALPWLPVPFVAASAADAASNEEEIFGFCDVCSAACALIAHVRNGRIVRLSGNPDCQVARGKLCVKGYGGHRFTYDPDRLKHPMKRTNPEKGPGEDPGWVKIAWDEAYQLVAAGFGDAIRKHGPESIAFFMRSHDYADRLLRAIGSPNRIQHESTCYTPREVIWRACTGAFPWMIDLGPAKYILSFGWDQPAKAKNHQAREFIKALENGAKAVVVDPRYSGTASLSHEWIPIRPGTDLAFCLAMIHVIIKEGLYDREFVANFTEGLDDIASAVRQYTPAWASAITDVPAETITRIAREFGTARPACIPMHKRDASGPNYANSWRLAHAQLVLCALVGSIDRPGGPVFQRTFSMPSFSAVFPVTEPFPAVRKDRADGLEKFPLMASGGRGNFATIANAMLTGKPYPIKAGLVRKYNVLAFPNAPRMTEAFKALDFLAVVDVLPTEIVQLADVVLPETTTLESRGFGPRSYHAHYPQIALRLPASKVLYETKGFGSIVMDIAKAMGLGKYFEGVSSTKWDEARLNAIGTTWQELAASPNGLFGEVRPFTPRTKFSTPSGKVELKSSVLENNGYDAVPVWKPKREEPSTKYPFYFLITRPPMHRMTTSQNDARLIEVYPENFLDIHPETAAGLGLKDGDLATVESRAGSIKIKVRLTQGIRPDCVCTDHGFGRWARQLTVAYRRGANDGDLIPDMTIEESLAIGDPGLGACMTDFCVSVKKA
ncbi:MAG: molybdopterin-dependent oxidoreductase [Bacillota bacterium]